MRRRSRKNFASRNREGLTFDQWAADAGLGARSTPGAHAAWAHGKNPVSWSRVFGKTMARNRGRSRRNPPPLYRGVGIDGSGRKVPLGTGPLSDMRSSTMAQWMGDRSLKSAYVLDAKGNSYLTLEPKDRARLMANVGSMDAAQFCEAVKSMVDTHGKALSCHSGMMGSHSQVFVDFINLPVERVREKRGGGAEGSNNRMLITVYGFADALGEPPPGGKVKVETRISLYGAPPALSKLRGKSGSPEAMAKYVADFISKVAAEVPGKYTHANGRKRTSRRSKRTSRRAR